MHEWRLSKQARRLQEPPKQRASQQSAMNAKTTTERVAQLRKDRDAQGLRRRELYLSDAEFEQVKNMIAALRAARAEDARKKDVTVSWTY